MIKFIFAMFFAVLAVLASADFRGVALPSVDILAHSAGDPADSAGDLGG